MAEIKNLFKFWSFVSLLLAVLLLSNFSLRSLANPLAQSASIFSNYSNESYTAALTTDVSAQAQTAINQVSPAVVSIYGYSSAPSGQTDNMFTLPFFHMSFNVPAPAPTEIDAGTGFIVSPNGYIVTANHVVGNGDSTYQVVLSDGSQTSANIVFQDPQADIAILKIDGNNLPTVNLGDSSALRLHQPVVGMGNALGANNNVASLGVVTALKRDITPSNGSDPGQTISGLFESNMQLYPGDSGGPTFDLNGNVIGINDAIAVNQQRVSFSIPINAAKAAINTIVSNN